MKEFVRLLFSEKNSKLKIELFNEYHFLYLFIIFGTAILLTCLLMKRSDKAKEKAVRVFAYLTIGLYVADFFIMPLSDSYNEIAVNKLPFHICTLMGVLVPFVQFGNRLDRIKTAVVSLSIVSSLMWMCYPGSALGGEPPFSYIIFQTFMYHGVLFTWGFLHLSLGVTKLSIKKIWKEFCIILVILSWASFGNAVYDDQNWFFVSESIFSFLEDDIMPLAVVASVFAACLLIYGIYYGVSKISKLCRKKYTADSAV